jgi:hypothetical protein
MLKKKKAEVQPPTIGPIRFIRPASYPNCPAGYAYLLLSLFQLNLLRISLAGACPSSPAPPLISRQPQCLFASLPSTLPVNSPRNWLVRAQPIRLASTGFLPGPQHSCKSLLHTHPSPVRWVLTCNIRSLLLELLGNVIVVLLHFTPFFLSSLPLLNHLISPHHGSHRCKYHRCLAFFPYRYNRHEHTS